MINLTCAVAVYAAFSALICQPVHFRHASETAYKAATQGEPSVAFRGDASKTVMDADEILLSMQTVIGNLGGLGYCDNALSTSADALPMPILNDEEIKSFILAERRIIDSYILQIPSENRDKLKHEIERIKIRENGLFRYIRLSASESSFDRVSSADIEASRRIAENKIEGLNNRASNQRTILIKRLIASLKTDVQEKLSQRLGFRASGVTDLLLVYSVKSVFVRQLDLGSSFGIEQIDRIVDHFANRKTLRIEARFPDRSHWGWFYYLLLTKDYAELVQNPESAAVLEKLDRRFQPYMTNESTRLKHINTDFLIYWANRYTDWKSGRFKWTLKDRDQALFPYDDLQGAVPRYHIDVIENFADRTPPNRRKDSNTVWHSGEFFSEEQKVQIREIENKYNDIPILGFVDGPEATERLLQRNAELKEILLPNQAVAYFQELILEVGLGNYLLAPAVARELGLSDAEREQILNLLENGTAEIEAWETEQRQAILRQALTTDLAKLLPQLEQRLGLQLEDIVKFDPGATYNPDSYTEPKGFYRAYSYFYNDQGDYFPDLSYYHHRKHLEQPK